MLISAHKTALAAHIFLHVSGRWPTSTIPGIQTRSLREHRRSSEDVMSVVWWFTVGAGLLHDVNDTDVSAVGRFLGGDMALLGQTKRIIYHNLVALD